MTLCPKCGEELIVGQFPFCPHGFVKDVAVIGDEVDYVDHNLGPEPVRITSMAQRAAIMKERGLVEYIRHTPVPGSDKSPHTTDWSKGSVDAQTLDNARVLLSRGRDRTVESDPEPVRNPFNFTATPEMVRDLDAAIRGSK